MRKYIYTGAVFIAFFGILALFTLSANNDAEGIRNGVLRFHVVANSDSDTDQSNKLAVRDGLAELCSELFADAPDKAAAMATAGRNADVIEDRAEQILRLRGCDMNVTATVNKRFFPTRHYEGVSLPAGVYDTIDISIGEAEGENFWCVMFPDICIGASSESSNRDKLKDVLHGGSYDMATDSDSTVVRFKFKLVELFETVKNLLFAQK